MIRSTTSKFLIARDPAAIRQVYDFSHLRGTALENAAKERVLAGLEINKGEGRLAFGLGHFAMMGANGEKTLACREYESLALSFEAEGVVVGGERPVMEVEGGCQFSEDLSRINPLSLPVARILGERPSDGEFAFHDEGGVRVRFHNIADEWPRKWVLVGIKLSGKGRLHVDRNDLGRILGHPFLIQFLE